MAAATLRDLRQQRGAAIWSSNRNTALVRLIAGNCYNTTFPRPADSDRLPPKGRIVALLNRRIERVHVNVDDLPRTLLAAQFPMGKEFVSSACRSLRCAPMQQTSIRK